MDFSSRYYIFFLIQTHIYNTNALTNTQNSIPKSKIYFVANIWIIDEHKSYFLRFILKPTR